MVLCCGMFAGTVCPTVAKDLQNPDLEAENTRVTAMESDKEETKISNTADGILQSGEGSFDINEPVLNEENMSDADEDENAAAEFSAEQSIVLFEAPTDESTVFRASDCLDTKTNANKYWKAYWRSGGNSENLTIENGTEVSMKRAVKLTSNANEEKDSSLLSRSSWNGRVMDSQNTPVSAGVYLMSPGGLWSTEFTVSKGFTAPKGGKVEITQENLYNSSAEIWGTNEAVGSKIKITKGNFKNTVWAGVTLNSKNGGICDFKPITVSVEEGETIWFEVTPESTSTTESNKWVHWNPVITYKTLDPTVLSLTASSDNFDTAPLGQSYSIKYKETLKAISADNIEIKGTKKDGGALSETPSVDSVTLADNTVTATFAGLERSAKYTVTLKNLDFDGMDTSEYTYSFTFGTKEPLSFEAYKASDSYNTSSNSGAVWRWQYRNDDVLYTDLTSVGSYGNGMSVKIDGKDYSVGKSWSTTGWWQGFGIGQYVMIGGNQSNASATSTGETAVKTFIAPSSGYVEITACDPSGNSKVWGGISSSNSTGASLKICKSDAADETGKEAEQLWPADNGEFRFKWDASKPSSGAEENFEPLTVAVNKGDRLYFEASSKGANWWGTAVYWDPVVTYKVIFPEATDMNFEDGGTYSPNFEYIMRFDDEMADISVSDIVIDGGAYVKSAGTLGMGDKLAFSFGGIKENTKYNVTVGGIRYAAVEDAAMSTEYSFSFTSGRIVEAGEITLDGGSLKVGRNKISVPLNNSADEKCSAALIVCVMRGTADDYEIESVEYISRSDIGASDRIETTVNITDLSDILVRVIPVNSLKSMKPYAEAADFTA